MTSENAAGKADETDERGRGILSASDREYLRSPEEFTRQAAHARERAIRERLENGLFDFPILFQHLNHDIWSDIAGSNPQSYEPELETALRDTIAFVFLHAGMHHALMGSTVDDTLAGRLLREAVEQTAYQWLMTVTHYNFEVEGEDIPYSDIAQRIEAGESVDPTELAQFMIGTDVADELNVEPIQAEIRKQLKEKSGETDE